MSDMMRMRKNMIERVKREGIVDTDKYRYKLRTFNGEHTQVLQIVRLPLADLGTTKAITGWQVMYKEVHQNGELVTL